MSAVTVLILEDEHAVREMIAFGLRRAGYKVNEAEVVRAARESIANDRPDIVIVDWMLPGASGLEFIRALKKDKETSDLPVIMLTARGSEDDKVSGLESGADDYLTKPFSQKELQARIRAVLRRFGGGADTEVLSAGPLVLDAGSHRVSVGERELALGPTEFRLLRFFMGHPERVYARGQLLDRVWGANVYVEERTVDVHIRRLRKALAGTGCDEFIQTVRGAGYRFSPPR
ncbi:MAG: phosphate regulon transcriptional regulator PhoB [Gammaproteobacteria bacterium]|nr:phosphate regulon transcriptional regulator PhoB [Gammaproteobacteria bacterium]